MGRNSAPPEVRLPGAVLNSFDRAIKERLIVVGANRGLCESRAVFVDQGLEEDMDQLG